MKKEEGNIELTKFLKGAPVSKILNGLFQQKVNKATYERTGLFLKVLNKAKINLVCLKSISFRGIPSECNGLRGVIWRLMLGYLPIETNRWEPFLNQKLKEYNTLLQDMKMPSVIRISSERSTHVPDENEELAKEIKTDVKRTKRDVAFFGKLANAPSTAAEKIEEETKEKVGSLLSEEEEDFVYSDKETHRYVLSRILYIYAKQNSGAGYIQGMNELLGVLYYCFYHNTVPELEKYVESDTFFCFTYLMTELKDIYSKHMDMTFGGIQSIIHKVRDIIKRVDLEYQTYLEEAKADIQLFALRWIMLLFAQDMDLPAVVRLWDSLLGDSERFLFFQYVVAEIIIEAKKSVIGIEFYEFVKAIQGIPRTMNLVEVLKKAGNMLAKDLKKDCYIGEHYC